MKIKMRRQRRNKANKQPTDLIFVDTESLPQKVAPDHPNQWARTAELHTLRLGCATYIRYEKGSTSRRKEIDFKTDDQFWDWCEERTRKNGKLCLFAHNVGFDATILKLWERFENGTFSFPLVRTGKNTGKEHRDPLFISDDPPTVIDFCSGAGNMYRFIDTLNYWRQSLEALGKSVGIPKLIMPEWDAPDEDWFIYCRQDVMVLEKSIVYLLRWLLDNDLGNFALTSPSLSMNAFRHRFMSYDILFHDCHAVRKLERQAYYGGQVECHQLGKLKGPIYQLDVTSLYPSVMKDNYFPVELDEFTIMEPGMTIDPLNLGDFGVAEVFLSAENRPYPKRTDIGIIFPLGEFWSTLCGVELGEAYRNGDIKQMGSWSRYKCKPIFTEFVEYFWSKRQEYLKEEMPVQATLVKLILNSLYGKYGQRSPEWIWEYHHEPLQEWGMWTEIDTRDNTRVSFRSIGSKVQRKVIHDEHDKAFPAVAGFVTAYGRQRMRELRKIAGFKETYYQAVDALYISKKGFNRLSSRGEIADKELGKLNIEHIGENAEFISCNNFTCGDITKRGSIKSKAEKLPNGKWEQTRFEHLASILSNPLKGGVFIGMIQKTMTEIYRKGDPQDDGKVIPLKLNEKCESICSW